jgi:hypothetical protein
MILKIIIIGHSEPDTVSESRLCRCPRLPAQGSHFGREEEWSSGRLRLASSSTIVSVESALSDQKTQLDNMFRKSQNSY